MGYSGSSAGSKMITPNFMFEVNGSMIVSLNRVILTEEDLLIDLTLHDEPASLLTKFAEKISRPTKHNSDP